MNRGNYEFSHKIQQEAWEHTVGLTLDMMLCTPMDAIDLSNDDINPFLLGKCIEAHGWEWDHTCQEREDCWDYYYHSDYPNKVLYIYTDSNTFKLTLNVYDKEEE